jgi:hypothetical protein
MATSAAAVLPFVPSARASTITVPCTDGTGTISSPCNGAALQTSVASAQPGDVVKVPNGYWAVTTDLVNTNGGFTLRGESPAAVIVFDAGSWTLGTLSPYTEVQNVAIIGLTFDGSQATKVPEGTDVLHVASAVHLINCVSCTFVDNAVIGENFGSWPAILFEGGASNRIAANIFAAPGAGNGGGSQLQLNAGPNTSSDFDVWGNVFDSVDILDIGISNLDIHGNVFGNQTLGCSIGINIIPAFNATSTNIKVSGNIIDGGQANTGRITGLSQAPEGQGTIAGLSIDHNVVKGVAAYISIDGGCVSCDSNTKTYSASVTNNFLTAYWVPSGIDLTGGSYGLVEDATVTENILTGPIATMGQNQFWTDSNTINAIVRDNINN